AETADEFRVIFAKVTLFKRLDSNTGLVVPLWTFATLTFATLNPKYVLILIFSILIIG
ncbi:hypothetical protein CHS0354_019014, partial [Potamilus streckersoni]